MPLIVIDGVRQLLRIPVVNTTSGPWRRVGEGAVTASVRWTDAEGNLFEFGPTVRPSRVIPAGEVWSVVARLEAPPVEAAHVCVEIAELTPGGRSGAVVARHRQPLQRVDREAFAGAVVVAQTPPAVSPGERVRIPLKVTNESEFTWDADPATGYLLRINAPDTPLRLVPLPLAVAPGAAVEAAVVVDAPTLPGRHGLTITLVKQPNLNLAAGSRFSDVRAILMVTNSAAAPLPAPFAPREPGLDVRRLDAGPLTVRPGQPATARLRVESSAAAPVEDLRVNVSWLGAGGDSIGTTEGAAELKLLAPGDVWDTELTVETLADLKPRFAVFAVSGLFEGGAFRLELEPVEIEAEPVARASIVALTPATRLLARAPQRLAFRISNEGETLFATQGQEAVVLRLRWQFRGRVFGEPGPRIPLPRDLAPGASLIVVLPVEPPTRSGAYELEVYLEPASSEGARPEQSADGLTVEIVAARDMTKAEEQGLRQDLARLETVAETLAYRDWAERDDKPSETEVAEATRALAGWPRRPLVSVVASVVSTSEAARLLTALEAQLYREWELCIALDPAMDEAAAARLESELRSRPQVRLVPIGEARDRWSALAAALEIAAGEYVCLLGAGVLPSRFAFLVLAAECVCNPELGWVYADYDHLDADGGRCGPVRQPGPDFELSRSRPYMGRASLYRLDRVRAAGGLRPEFGAWAEYDLELRMGEVVSATDIRHRPQILFHRTPEADVAMRSPAAPGERALASHLARKGIEATVRRQDDVASFRIRYAIAAPAPEVSIIIPTRDRIDLLSSCVGSILDRTRYPDYEILIVDNGSELAETQTYLAQLVERGDARVVRDDRPFNWSRLNNLAARVCTGNVLCFLNNDTEVINESWLEELVAHAQRREIGIVGAALWYPNSTVQHAGVGFNERGLPFHLFRTEPRGAHPDYLRVVRQVGAVTGACMVMRRGVFEQAGGFDESLPNGYNDIDFSLRVQEELGLACIWTPHAELFHKESATRGRPRTDAERTRVEKDLELVQGRYYERIMSGQFHGLGLPGVGGGLTGTGELGRQGVPVALKRCRLPRPTPLAFLHIPKTAGTALQAVLKRELPRGSVLSIGARTLIKAYAGDPDTLARLRRRLKEVDVLVSHVSHGFGDLVGWPCLYATMVRNPVARSLSHYGFLIDLPISPLRNTPLEALTAGALLRKGVLPANLMIRKILGEAPEPAAWSYIEARNPQFAGFRLPEAFWRGDFEAILAAPDLEPDEDLSKVERAMEIVERDFCFVGRQEAADAHLARLFEVMGVGGREPSPHMNVHRVDRQDQAVDPALEAFNRLDQALYDRIAGMEGGLFLKPERFTGWR